MASQVCNCHPVRGIHAVFCPSNARNIDEVKAAAVYDRVTLQAEERELAGEAKLQAETRTLFEIVADVARETGLTVERKDLPAVDLPLNRMTSEEFAAISALQNRGWAVICWTPEELREADSERVHDRSVELGWEVIEDLQGL